MFPLGYDFKYNSDFTKLISDFGKVKEDSSWVRKTTLKTYLDTVSRVPKIIGNFQKL